jgi:ferredoxin-NADP reductase
LAEQRTATLQTNEELTPQTWLLTFVLEPATEFPYVAGKYIIVDTGLLLPDGKLRKRAYTLVSFDAPSATFQIAVRHVGPATEYLHALKPGEQLRFSGPWGKYLPHQPDKDEKIMIIATDTGITAALGLLQASELKHRVERIELVWWLPSADYFIPKELAETKLGILPIHIVDTPPIGALERTAQSQQWLAEKLRAGLPTRVYLSGDGLIILPWVEMLNTAGISPDRIHIETFFNHAKSKA